jgi:hypothetical protein
MANVKYDDGEHYSNSKKERNKEKDEKDKIKELKTGRSSAFFRFIPEIIFSVFLHG